MYSEKIQEQINKLFTEISTEQQKINGIKPADEDKKNLVEETLRKYQVLRGRNYFFNYLSEGRGHGPFTQLIDGAIKYDLINSIGVNLLGHAHPIYIKAHLEAAMCDTIMCGNLLAYQEPNLAAEELLKAVSKSRLKHFWYSGSGSFANDTALKIIWQKKAPKYKLIAFEKAFAGRSVATQDITFNAAYREGMPRKIEVEYAPHFDQNDPENSINKTIAALDGIWAKDPNGYCALMMELIQGEAGFVYGTPEYYRAVFDWARNKGIYIWVDEVQTFGRTHELFAFQMFGLDQYVDLVTIGKALQACGTLYTEELNPKPGLIAGTFNGSLVGLKAAQKTVRYLLESGYYGDKGRIRELERIFISKLRHLAQTTCKDKIGYIGGVGTMISFEVGDSGKDITNKFLQRLFENGVIGFSAGKDPMRVRFLLPVILKDEHIDEIFDVIERTALDVL